MSGSDDNDYIEAPKDTGYRWEVKTQTPEGKPWTEADLKGMTIDSHPLDWESRRGTQFRSRNRDLSHVVNLSNPDLDLTDFHNLSEEITEFIGWYATEVYPKRPRFGGWDTVRYTLEGGGE